MQQGRIGMFHRSWEAGHNNTDYVRYYTALPGAVYRVTEYQAAYEPYIIFRRDALAWCDERFVGYGANKAACVFELHLAGTALYVLADHFLIHQTHAYAEAARKHEVRLLPPSPAGLTQGCICSGSTTGKSMQTSRRKLVSGRLGISSPASKICADCVAILLRDQGTSSDSAMTALCRRHAGTTLGGNA